MGSNNGNAMNVDGANQNRWQQQIVPQGETPRADTVMAGQFTAGIIHQAAENVKIGAPTVADYMPRPVAQPVDANPIQMTNIVQSIAASASRLKSIIVGPSSSSDPMIPVVPSLIKKVPNFISACPSFISFRFLTSLDIDHETIVPSYFNDKQILIHLAFILSPQLGDNALEKLALDYLEEEEEEDPDMMIEHEDEEDVIIEQENTDQEKIVEEE